MKETKTDVFDIFSIMDYEKEAVFPEKNAPKRMEICKSDRCRRILSDCEACEPEDVVYQLDYNPGWG